MKFKRIILMCLLLVLAGAGIWYVQSEKRNTAFKPLEKEEIPTETGASVQSGSGLNEIGKSEFLKVPENAFGEAGAAVSLLPVDLVLESSLEKSGEPNLGTAQFIGGKTVLISIFVNNTEYNWDFEDSDDVDAYSRLYYRLQSAAEWIEELADNRDVSCDIVWDWYNNDDLFYVTEEDCDMAGPIDSLYPSVSSWIQAHVDAEQIVSEYEADNVIFMCYNNSDPDNDQPSCAYAYDFYNLTDQQIGYEAVWFNIGYKGFTNGAPALAHEILHCFGAVDLYYSNDQITDEYVDYLASIDSEDIMYMLYDEPDEINEQFSELDAYYVGLTPYSSDAEQFGLGQSSHFADQ